MMIVELALLSAVWAATETYQWTDEAGVTHFAGEERPGAERELVHPIPTTGFGPSSEDPAAGRSANPGGHPLPGQPAENEGGGEAADFGLLVDAVEAGAGAGGEARALEVSVTVAPSRDGESYRFVYYLDGERRLGPTDRTRVTLEGVGPGAHRLSVKVVDRAGEEVGSIGPMSVRQP